jgi:Cd2+/Zn2+-exporting ATPase
MRKSRSENFITKFARVYTPAVCYSALALAVLPPLVRLLLHMSPDWSDWIFRALTFLVISCPCALVISIPLTFFGGVGAASRHGVLVKGSNYLEALSKVDTLVFDKTGTLTKGVFKVTEILPEDGISERQVLEYAAIAEQFSTHPIAQSILSACGTVREGTENYREIPGKGVLANFAGKRLAVGNAALMEAEKIPFTPCGKAGTKVYVAAEGQYIGCIVIADEIKADSAQTIVQLKAMGVAKTVMLTGDEEAVANEVAQALGIDACHAKLLPQEKLALLEQLDGQKKASAKLAFVGDGINDAPVLARADVGIAMGGLGADAAIEAADVVLMTDEPSRLLDAIRIAKATKGIVAQNIVLALGLKGIVLLLGALGIAGMWAAVFADVGVAILAVLNAMRILKK